MGGAALKRWARALVGLAVSAVALWLTLRGRDLGAIWQAVLGGDYRYLVPFSAILAAIYLSRVVRWGILLQPVARVPFARLNAASAVGFMAVLVLPLRLGELARPYLVADGRALRVSAALSSVVVERVADGLFTALLLVVTLFGVPTGTPGVPFIRAVGVAVFLAFSALLGLLLLAYRNRDLAVSLTRRLVAPVSPSASERIAGMLDAFIHGLRVVPSRGKVALFLLLTIVYWGLSGYAIRVLSRGFGFDLSLLASYTVLGVLVAGVMIPAGPGMVGTTQAAVVLGLSLFAPRELVDTQGNAFANVLWAAQLAFQVGLGMIFLWSRHIRIGSVLRAPRDLAEELEAAQYQSRVTAPTTPRRERRSFPDDPTDTLV